MRQILQQFPRRTYVGYTATPFANVLIDSDENHPEFGPSLYPRDFIYCLPQPGGYIGLDDYFPEHGDEIGLERQVTILPQEEVTELLIDEERNQIPESLQSAIRQFIISGSLRLIDSNDEPLHHSMMIHIHHETRFQNPLSNLLRDKLIRRWRNFCFHQITDSIRKQRICLGKSFEDSKIYHKPAMILKPIFVH